MSHLEEHEHAFIKNNVVEHIFVFDESAHTSGLLETVKTEQGCDTVICLCNHGSVPARWSTWDGTTFTDPTLDYLYSIGVTVENQAMHDERLAKIEAALQAALAAEATPTA